MNQRPYQFSNPDGVYFTTFSIINWIDVFTRERYKQEIVQSLNFCQKFKGLEIFAWCLMTNHLHLVIRAKKGCKLSDIVRDFKKYTAARIIKSIQNIEEPESRREWMLWMFERAARKNIRNSRYQFWQQNNHAEELYSVKFIQQKIKYIHENPVKEGITEKPWEYLYSSSRDYEANQKGLVEIIFV